MFGLKLNVLPAVLALPWLVAPAPARPAAKLTVIKTAAHQAKWSRMARTIISPAEETVSIGKLPLARNKIIDRPTPNCTWLPPKSSSGPGWRPLPRPRLAKKWNCWPPGIF